MLYILPTDTCFWLACNIYDSIWYKRIFDIKKRNDSKILSISLEKFDDLNKYTSLNASQLDFLSKYKFPYTIVTKINKNFVLPDFLDKVQYENIWFRIAENFLNEEILQKIDFPIFLTSANISWEKEIFDSSELLELFNWIEDIKIFEWKINKKPSSDVFSFVWDSLDLNYFRKNY